MEIANEAKTKGEILQCLRANPRGMTVTQISRIIDLNRNSTAKYLDILKINGQIDMRPMGRAKVYYISHRVPISALLNFSTDYILVLDSNARIIEVNENFQKLFKVKKEMLLDVSLQSSNLPIFNTTDTMSKIINAIKGQYSGFELKIEFDVGFRFFRGKLIPSTLGDGTNGVTIIMENVTEQKKAEEKLRMSEERYRELIENQGEGLCITDMNNIFTFANPAAERLLEVGSGGLIGRSVLEFVPSSEKQKIILQSERRKNGKKDTYHIDMFTDHGNRKEILLTATPRYDYDGNFIGSLGVFRDITTMKRNQSMIRESELKFRSLFETSSDGILILRNRKIVECNRSAVKLFGYTTKDELIGKNPASLSPEYQDDGTLSEQAVISRFKEADIRGFVGFIWKHRTCSGGSFLADVRLHKIELEDDVFYQATLRDISEMIRIQNEVNEKQKIMDNILSSLYGSFIGLIGPDFEYVNFWGSSELDESYGLSSSEIPGRSVLDFAPPENRDDLKRLIENIFETGEPVRIEVSSELPDGRVWHLMSFSPFKDIQGDIKYVVQHGSDTTEKNHAYRSLEEVEKRYKLLDTNATDVIWIANIDLKTTYISSYSRELTGHSSDELLGRSLVDMIDEESIGMIKRNYEKIMDDFLNHRRMTKRSFKMEIQINHRNGSKVWTETSISILTDDDERPVGLMGVTRDISEKKRFKDELLTLSSAMKLVFEAIIIFDQDGRIKFANDEAKRMFGIGEEVDSVEKTIYGLLKPEDHDDARKIVERVYRDGVVRDIEYSIRGQDGKLRYLQTTANNLEDSTGNTIGYITITRDITRIKTSMKEIELKGRILETISTIASLIEKEGDRNEKIRKSLEELGRAAKVSRAYIFQNEQSKNMGILTTQIFEWSDDDHDTQSENPDLVNFPLDHGFHRWEEELSSKNAIFGNIREFPETEKEILRRQGIISIAVVPIFIKDQWWGFIGFDECSRERKWFPEEIEALKTAGSIIGLIVSK